MNGFTYNGIHCSTYNVYYIPDAADRWFESPEFENYQKDVQWKHGGYYYGNSVKIRTIEIKCMFEEIDIATREKIRRWLGRDTSGQLIFDDKPFVYYNVRPSAVVPGKIYNDTDESYSGTFTVKFTAEDPFGYLTRKFNTWSDFDGATDYCGIISYHMDEPIDPSTSGTEFTVYNSGTEDCGMSVKLAGTCSNPFRLFNRRNGSQCVISSLPSNGLYLDIDGDTGNVITYLSTPDVGADNGFAYHDHGFVRLSPCEHFEPNTGYKVVKNLFDPSTNRANVTGGSGVRYTLSYTLTEDISSVKFMDITMYGDVWMMEVVQIGPASAGRKEHSMLISDPGVTSIGISQSDIDQYHMVDIQVESGSTASPYVPYGGNTTAIVFDDIAVTEEMIGGRFVQYSGALPRRSGNIIAIHKPNTIYIDQADPYNPLTAPASVYTENRIVIEEKNDNGNWVTPTTLDLSHISVDYKPRLL